MRKGGVKYVHVDRCYIVAQHLVLFLFISKTTIRVFSCLQGKLF